MFPPICTTRLAALSRFPPLPLVHHHGSSGGVKTPRPQKYQSESRIDDKRPAHGKKITSSPPRTISIHYPDVTANHGHLSARPVVQKRATRSCRNRNFPSSTPPTPRKPCSGEPLGVVPRFFRIAEPKRESRSTLAHEGLGVDRRRAGRQSQLRECGLSG